MATLGQRYKLWWPRNNAQSGGVGILVEEEISRNVVKVKRNNNRVKAIMLTIGREVI